MTVLASASVLALLGSLLLLSAVPTPASRVRLGQIEFLVRTLQGRGREVTVPAKVELLTQASSALNTVRSLAVNAPQTFFRLAKPLSQVSVRLFLTASVTRGSDCVTANRIRLASSSSSSLRFESAADSETK